MEKKNKTWLKALPVAVILLGALTSYAAITKRASEDPTRDVPAVMEEKPIYTTYGIAFYNLENLFDTINSNGTYDLEFSPKGARKWDSEKYWAKVNKMAYAISQMTTPETPDGPAVIGISEIENESVVKDLVNAEPLKGWNLKYVHHDSPDNRGIDVALLYNPKMFEVLSVTNTRLSAVPFATRDQMAVTGRLGGYDTLTVIVNHWPSRLGGQDKSEPNRIEAAKLSRHIADSLWEVNPNQHVIVMGDLNDDPNNRSVSMSPGLGAGSNPKNTKTHGFFNPWWDIWEPEFRGTLSYKGEWNLFDQIIISGTLIDNKKGKGTGNLIYKSAQINDFDFLKNPPDSPYAGTPHRTYGGGNWLDGYSDHFPTEIFLKVRE